MSLGSIVAVVFGALLAASLQLGILHRGDFALAVALTLLFYVRPGTAITFAAVAGAFLDLYSALFGIRLIAYPIIVMAARRLLTSLLDRSAISALIIGLGGYGLFTLVFSLISLSVAFVRHTEPSFTFLSLASDIAFGFGAQIVYVLLFMGGAFVLKKR